jgi:salicylate synthetase
MPDDGDTAVPPSTLTAIMEPARCRDAALPCVPFRDFVLYEKDSIWHYAGGTAAQLSVDTREVTASWPGKKDRVAWEDNPLPTVSRLLSEFPGDRWNPHGWVTFEFTPRPVPTDVDRAEYCAAVEAAVADIRDRLLEKVIMSRRVPAGRDFDMAAAYQTGREANTPARSFLLCLDGRQAAGFSPETVVEVDGSGRVSTQPLAGTRAFGLGIEHDRALSAELRSDPKEIYEHATSMRSSWLELGSVCTPGSVRVDEPMELRFRDTVQHLGSVVSGQLAAGCTPLDALAAVFPAAPASGIPKAPACACISRLESAARGPYAGSVFQLGSGGNLDAALMLRSVFQTSGSAWLQAGAGIVGPSRPEREFEETREKLGSVARHIVPGEAETSAALAAAGSGRAHAGTVTVSGES